MKSVYSVATALATLTKEEFALAVKFGRELQGRHIDAKKSLAKPKRKYTRRAPKAVEVAPGVKVVRKQRGSSGEIDHSPKSMSEV